jgi:hypothetical protein
MDIKPIVNIADRSRRAGKDVAGQIAGADSIGWSYDVFGGTFGGPSSTRVPLFDLGAPVADPVSGQSRPAFVRVQAPRSAQFVRVESRQSRNIQTELATRAKLSGSYGFFAGEVSASFSESVRSSSEFHFVQESDRLLVYLLRLSFEGSDRAALIERARTDIDGLDPQRLYEAYGTHYLRTLFIGAKASYNCATNTTSYKSQMSVAAAAELSYKFLTGQIKGSMSASQKSAFESLQQNSTIRVFADGGDITLARQIMDGQYGAWLASVNSHLAFVELNDDSLAPLSDLAEGERRRELEAAYLRFAESQALEPEATLGPVYAFHVSDKAGSRWCYSLNKDDQPRWQRLGTPFRAFSKPQAGTVPIYRHTAANPERYHLSTQRAPGNGWSEATEPAFHAYPGGGDGREAVYGFTANATAATSGWHYCPAREVKGWTNQGVVFYAPVVDAPGYQSV